MLLRTEWHCVSHAQQIQLEAINPRDRQVLDRALVPQHGREKAPGAPVRLRSGRRIVMLTVVTRKGVVTAAVGEDLHVWFGGQGGSDRPACLFWHELQMFTLASQGFRTIAHDRRGHGRSTQTWNGNDMDTYPLWQWFRRCDPPSEAPSIPPWL